MVRRNERGDFMGRVGTGSQTHERQKKRVYACTE